MKDDSFRSSTGTSAPTNRADNGALLRELCYTVGAEKPWGSKTRSQDGLDVPPTPPTHEHWETALAHLWADYIEAQSAKADSAVPPTPTEPKSMPPDQGFTEGVYVGEPDDKDEEETKG